MKHLVHGKCLGKDWFKTSSPWIIIGKDSFETSSPWILLGKDSFETSSPWIFLGKDWFETSSPWIFLGDGGRIMMLLLHHVSSGKKNFTQRQFASLDGGFCQTVLGNIFQRSIIIR